MRRCVRATMAAEIERELIQELTLDGLSAAEAQGRRDGRPFALNADTLAVVRARHANGESVTVIAKYLKNGGFTLYRALEPEITGTASITPAPARATT